MVIQDSGWDLSLSGKSPHPDMAQFPSGAHHVLHLTAPAPRVLEYNGLMPRRTFVDAVFCGVMIMQFAQWVSFSRNDRTYTKLVVVCLLYLQYNSVPRKTRRGGTR